MKEKKNMYLKDIRDSNEFYHSEQYVTENLYKMVTAALPNAKTVLDPCCGACGLELFNNGYVYTLIDIDTSRVPTDVQQQVIQANFLNDKIPQIDGKKFDFVVVNPPFSLTPQFVDKCLEYSDNIFLVSTIKTAFKKYGHLIENFYLDSKISFLYNTLVSIGLFHINKNASGIKLLKQKSVRDILKPINEKDSMLYHTTKCNKHKLSLPFICLRITKGRVIYNRKLISDIDIYEANNDEVFRALSGNVNVSIGDALERNLIYFDTMENAKKFQKLYNSEKITSFIREYCYLYGDSILGLKHIPFFESEGIVMP